MVGLLIDRKGEVRFVMVGTATRLYLPDIGRARGGQERLRGLRLIVARPTPLNVSFNPKTNKNAPCLAHDFRTDLEKLRLDLVVEIEAHKENADGMLVLGHLAVDNLDSEPKVITNEKVFSSVFGISETFPELLDAVLADLALAAPKPVKKTAGFKDRALVVGVYAQSKDVGLASLAEIKELARSAKVEVVESITQWRKELDPKTIIGKGKLEDICLRALSLGVELIIFDCDLSPSQLMTISDQTDLKILDRTMLILDIFAQRAVTREGKMQVEMAQLAYSLPRLREKQTGMSRLTGGIGGRGPGETKLEVNKRRVKDKLARLSAELEKIKDQRALRRKSRLDNQTPTLAIVGYTNAGKSTLLNALSNSDVYAKDELFATLDPHSKRLRFPTDQEVVITDTVGFIQNLPKDLLKAFMATLEELTDADILLHVVDIADEGYKSKIAAVNEVLTELDAQSKETILVFNKIDNVDPEVLALRAKNTGAVLISAVDKIGLDKLIAKCVKAIGKRGKNVPKKSHEIQRSDEEIFFDHRPKDNSA